MFFFQFLTGNVENVGRPLAGLLNGNEDFLLYYLGDPQGASLHHIGSLLK